jgi:O-acetyl-ADP-ribose deacetylase (regulator of RNase III)
VYQFPVERASHLAMREIVRELETNMNLERVTIVCFHQETYEAYRAAEQKFIMTP